LRLTPWPIGWPGVLLSAQGGKMPVFSAYEVIQFAVKIEENGEEFYRQAAGKFNHKAIKDTFLTLADEEIQHRQIFAEIMAQVENYEPAESFGGEYSQYLRSYASEHIFTKEKTAKFQIAQIKAVAQAIDFAIEMELDSIHYYTEAKNLVPPAQRGIIDRIIEQELQHYLKLNQVKKNNLN